LLNCNQIRAFGITVYDNPFDPSNKIGMELEEAFIPFDMCRTIVHFETRVLTPWEIKHLPVIFITGEDWNPNEEVINPDKWSREQIEMRTILSLTSGMSRKQVMALHRSHTNAQIEHDGEVERELGKISPVYNARTFCERALAAVKIATVYRDDVDEQVNRRSAGAITTDRHSQVTPEELARKWNIGLETAKDTIKVTTQQGIRHAVHPMNRRLRVDHMHLHRPRLRGTWYCDTLIAKVRSLDGNKCANVFTQGKFTKVVPMTARSDAGKSLIEFTDDVGIPEMLVTDGATEFTGRHTEFVKQARYMRIKLHTTESGRKNQNHAAEREIGVLSQRWRLRMEKKGVPKVLWDFGLIYESELLTRMA
jgi:hypothetical protein